MVEVEKEITVKLKWELDEAKVFFVNTGRALTGSFILKDIYMVKDDVDIYNTPNLKILSKAVVLREGIGNEHVYQIVYKDKQYDEYGNILNSKKYVCDIKNIEDAYNLLEAIGFKECFRYEQECLEYNDKDRNVLLQYVPDLGLFAEIEDHNKSIDELIKDLNDINIPYYEGDYFVKKASLMLDEVKKQRR